MAAEINRLNFMTVDDSSCYSPVDELSCSAIADNIINYFFDIADYSKDIGPAVSRVCDNLNTNEIEDLNKVLNKFYNNLNE